MTEVNGNPTKIPVWRVNAFTDKPFTGNPAGVVPEADGLSEPLMQAIAAELNDISETVFVCRPDVAHADVKLRYFTSSTEVDLCGHATVAALFTLAWLGRISGENETKMVRAQTKIGVLELAMTFAGGEPAWAAMEQLEPQHHSAPGAAMACAVLGLPETALCERLPVACASSGLWSCFVPLKDLAALERVQINRERIEELWPDNPDLTGVYPFVMLDKNTSQGRFFSPPKYGIFEDPVTGTACGALGAYLLSHGVIPADGELTARQGFEMGRGGCVKVRRNRKGKIVIKGQAVAVFTGIINNESLGKF